jgi:ADP-ribose pyrophosphatase
MRAAEPPLIIVNAGDATRILSENSMTTDLKTLCNGRHLSLVERGDWEFVTRSTKTPAVGIVAVTNNDCVVLVEQFRPPVGQNVIELPAGLSGDVSGAEHESLLEAAKRELLEETGYRAGKWTELGSGFSSPGLTDEEIVLFLAEDLEKVGQGGGDSNERITIHEVPLQIVVPWLADKKAKADLKLLAGLYAAQARRTRRAAAN